VSFLFSKVGSMSSSKFSRRSVSSVFSVFVKFFWKLNSKPGSVPGTGWKSIWVPSLSMYGSVSEVMTSLNTMVESEKQLNLNVTNMYVIVN
jgi:hypothetical protein